MSRDCLFRVTYNKKGKKRSSIIHARDEQSAGRAVKGRVLHVQKMGMTDIFNIGGFADAMTKKITIESFQSKDETGVDRRSPEKE
jgi:hypothetical protein